MFLESGVEEACRRGAHSRDSVGNGGECEEKTCEVMGERWSVSVAGGARRRGRVSEQREEEPRRRGGDDVPLSNPGQASSIK